jgi:hypothetical protein
MKKTLAVTTLTLLAGAVSVYAQGEVSLADYAGGFSIQVFQSQSLAASTSPVSYGGISGSELMGNTGNTYSTSPGSASYKAGSAAGTGYDVELLLAEGSGLSASQLSPVGPIVTTWGAAAGASGTGTAGFGGIWTSSADATFGAAGDTVTVAIAAWNGAYSSLAAAQAAGLGNWGVSDTATLVMGGGKGAPSILPAGLESFSLTAAVPEPSTIALGVMGASALLFRRKK